jgi:hypothetical protein
MASTQDTIKEHYPSHFLHRDRFGPPEPDFVRGILCGCGKVLPWPAADTLRVANPPSTEAGRAAWDAAGRPVAEARARAETVQGAYGEYPVEPVDAELVEEPREDVSQRDSADDTPPEPPPASCHASYYEVEPDCLEEAVPGTKFCQAHQRIAERIADEERELAQLQDGPDPDQGVTEAVPRRDLAPLPGSGVPIMPPPGAVTDDPVNASLDALDPTRVYTPADVELQMLDISRRLGNGERFLRTQIDRLQKAEHAHTMKYNLTIAQSQKKSADQRKAEAVIACEYELYELTEAKMLVGALRGTLHNLRAQLIGFMSVAKSIGVSLGAPQVSRRL